MADSLDHSAINQFKGKVGMIFITHAMPKSLLVDEIVRIGKGALSAVGGKDDVRTVDEQGMRNEKT